MAKNEALHHDVTPSFIAGAALLPYTAVKLASARNTVEQATANTDKTFGITLGEAAAAGDSIAVKKGGFALARVGAGNWTKGAYLTPTTDGKLIVSSTAAHIIVGIAMEAATADELGEIQLFPFPVRYDGL